MPIIIKFFIRVALVAALFILSGCATTISTTEKVLNLDSLADQAYRENRCDDAIKMYSIKINWFNRLYNKSINRIE